MCVKASADAFKDMDFVADDAKLSGWAVDDPWAHRFVAEMSSVLAPMAGQLTSTNYDRVVLQTAQTVAERCGPADTRRATALAFSLHDEMHGREESAFSSMLCVRRMTRQVFELHSFTVEGGLQLEKDVRTIGVGFAELTPDRIPAYKGDVRSLTTRTRARAHAHHTRTHTHRESTPAQLVACCMT